MSGAEFFAIVAHLKENHSGGTGLETDLMKVKRQQDKRRHLIEWIQQQYGTTAPPAAVPALPVSHPPLEQQRPNTARGDFAGGAAMKNLLAEAPPPTAPPATARAESVPQPALQPVPQPAKDMSPVVNQFVSGKDHLSMSGAEFHGLVAWLKTQGHPDVEDQLMRVKVGAGR